jgi:GABA(A) receptor-associated protein
MSEDTGFKSIRFEDRKSAVRKLSQLHPGYLPVYIERANNRTPDLKHKQYLVNKKDQLGSFIREVRKKIPIGPTDAIFVFVDTGKNAISPMMSSTIEEVYNRYKKEDGVLYLKYTLENVFG